MAQKTFKYSNGEVTIVWQSELFNWETKAIDQRKKQGYDTKEYETILENMKKKIMLD